MFLSQTLHEGKNKNYFRNDVHRGRTLQISYIHLAHQNMNERLAAFLGKTKFVVMSKERCAQAVYRLLALFLIIIGGGQVTLFEVTELQ